MTKDSQGLLSDLDVDRIIELVEALDRSNFDSLQLDVGRFRLTLGKGAIGEPTASATAAAIGDPSPSLAPAASAAAPAPPAPKPAAPKPAPASDPSLVEVRSPIMGLFYSRPDPGSPPFVAVGAAVEEGTTVGLIEVMKVFNAVQAGAKGVIAEICVEDAQTIDIGQTLFRIRASA